MTTFLNIPLLSCSRKRLLWCQSFILTTKNVAAVVFYLFSSHHNILFEEDLFFADVFYLYSGTWPEWDLLFLPPPLNGWCANIKSVRRTVNWTRPLSAAPLNGWMVGAEEVEVERKQSLSGSPHQGIKIMMLVWFRKGSTTVWFLCFVLTGSFVNWVTHWGVVGGRKKNWTLCGDLINMHKCGTALVVYFTGMGCHGIRFHRVKDK